MNLTDPIVLWANSPSIFRLVQSLRRGVLADCSANIPTQVIPVGVGRCRMRLRTKSIVLVAVGLATPHVAHAGAPALSGRIASADSAETAFTNPAGMARLGESAATVEVMLAQSFGEFEVD